MCTCACTHTLFLHIHIHICTRTHSCTPVIDVHVRTCTAIRKPVFPPTLTPTPCAHTSESSESGMMIPPVHWLVPLVSELSPTHPACPFWHANHVPSLQLGASEVGKKWDTSGRVGPLSSRPPHDPQSSLTFPPSTLSLALPDP